MSNPSEPGTAYLYIDGSELLVFQTTADHVTLYSDRVPIEKARSLRHPIFMDCTLFPLKGLGDGSGGESRKKLISLLAGKQLVVLLSADRWQERRGVTAGNFLRSLPAHQYEFPLFAVLEDLPEGVVRSRFRLIDIHPLIELASDAGCSGFAVAPLQEILCQLFLAQAPPNTGRHALLCHVGRLRTHLVHRDTPATLETVVVPVGLEREPSSPHVGDTATQLCDMTRIAVRNITADLTGQHEIIIAGPILEDAALQERFTKTLALPARTIGLQESGAFGLSTVFHSALGRLARRTFAPSSAISFTKSSLKKGQLYVFEHSPGRIQRRSPEVTP